MEISVRKKPTFISPPARGQATDLPSPFPFRARLSTATARRSFTAWAVAQGCRPPLRQRAIQQMTDIHGHFRHPQLLHNPGRLVLIVDGNGRRAEVHRDDGGSADGCPRSGHRLRAVCPSPDRSVRPSPRDTGTDRSPDGAGSARHHAIILVVAIDTGSRVESAST